MTTTEILETRIVFFSPAAGFKFVKEIPTNFTNLVGKKLTGPVLVVTHQRGRVCRGFIYLRLVQRNKTILVVTSNYGREKE